MSAVLTLPYVRGGADGNNLPDAASCLPDAAMHWEPLATSQTFNPAQGFPDIILVSSDHVLFFVNSTILLCASHNAFDALPQRVAAPDDSHASFRPFPAVQVPEDERVLTVVLHAIYGLDLPQSGGWQDFACLEAATYSLLVRYAMHVPHVLAPGRVLYAAAARLAQLDAYTLAAAAGCEPLAAECSARLAARPLHAITDARAQRIGPRYLCRLFNLQIHRAAALRALLAPAPRALAACVPACPRAPLDDFEGAWTAATAALLRDGSAGVQDTTLEAAFRPLLVRLCCTPTYNALEKHITGVVARWSSVPKTI